MSGKRNVSVCSGHELANALYFHVPSHRYLVPVSQNVYLTFQWPGASWLHYAIAGKSWFLFINSSFEHTGIHNFPHCVSWKWRSMSTDPDQRSPSDQRRGLVQACHPFRGIAEVSPPSFSPIAPWHSEEWAAVSVSLCNSRMWHGRGKCPFPWTSENIKILFILSLKFLCFVTVRNYF